MTGWDSVPAAHPLAATAWVGGMSHAPAVPRPTSAVPEPPRRVAPHVRTFRRLFPVVRHAAPAAPLSGHTMPFGVCGAPRGAPWTVRAAGPPVAAVAPSIAPDPVWGTPAIAAAGPGHRG